MATKSIHGALFASAFLLFISPMTSEVAQATTIGTDNSTLTTYNASTGDVSFEWDLGSAYDITGDTVTVYVDEITFGGGLIGPTVVGTLYEFVIPNFFDPLPLKKILVTMEGTNQAADRFDLPQVLDVIGADSEFGCTRPNGCPAQPVFGAFDSVTTAPTLVTEYWEMVPNPDFEVVKLYAPAAFQLETITIATQSTVPVPASVWLFASGLLGMVGIARRKA